MWCRFVYHLDLLGVDRMSKSVAISGKNVHGSQHVLNAASIQSAGIRKSRSLTLWTLVFALRRRRLKSLPSVQYLMLICDAWICVQEGITQRCREHTCKNENVKSVGADKQPCFTQFVTEEG